MTGRWSEEELVAMIPELLAARSIDAAGVDAYGGIGSRETPQDVADEMTLVGAEMERRGFRLRSGGADGKKGQKPGTRSADISFEQGVSDRANKDIYVPWKGFAGNPDGMVLAAHLMDRAYAIAEAAHPAWERCSEAARKLHTRNVPQVLGSDLESPAKAMICWTSDGGATGGTGQAIRIADANGIPVLNMQRPAIRQAVLDALGIARQREQERSGPARDDRDYVGMSMSQRLRDDTREATRQFKQGEAPVRAAAKGVDPRQPYAGGFDYAAATAPAQDWQRDRSAVFFRVSEENGPLSNMDPRSTFEHEGVKWNSEAMFQAMRFPERPDIQERIHAAGNPMAAKAVSREFIGETRSDWQNVNVQAMAYVLTARQSSDRYASALAATQGRHVVEQSSRDDFWGAKGYGPTLRGQNVLGRLQTQQRGGARELEMPRGTSLPNAVEMAALREARVAGRDWREALAEVRGAAPADASAEAKLHYRPGADVSKMSADVIVNTVNANLSKASPDGSRQAGNPVMGKGVALAFSQRYGDALLKPYAAAIAKGELKAGGVQLLTMPDGQTVANLATKQDWRDNSRIEWVESGLKALAAEMKAAGHRSVALPPPGCGNGGLDWKDVEPLVAKHLKDFDVTVTAAPASSRMTGRDGAEVKGVESRASVLDARRDERRWNEGRPSRDQGNSERRPEMNATMYFAYGRDRRPGVKSASTFEAILAGERTSTTRFDSWKGSDRWGRIKPGAVVRMFEDKDMKGRFVDVAVTSVERLDLGKATPERIEDWSKAEGWSVEHARQLASKGPAWQVRYEPVPGQEILKEREIGREAVAGRGGGFDRSRRDVSSAGRFEDSRRDVPSGRAGGSANDGYDALAQQFERYGSGGFGR